MNGLTALVIELKQWLNIIGFDLGSSRLSLWSIGKFFLAALLLYMVARLAIRLVKRLTRRSKRLDGAQQLLVEKLGGVVVVVASFLLGIDLLGLDLTTFAVFSGALGLAVGFGMQKTVGNLIAGIILLMDRSIKPGDVIVVGEAVGRVNKIGVRAVSVVTRDGKEHLVPNELLMTERVENWSYSSRDVRVRIAVGVSYQSDIRRAQALMLDAARETARVLVEPAPMVWITSFGDDSIDHELRFWITDPEAGLGNVQGEVFLRIWDKFKAEGVEFPYPQRDIHIRSMPTAAVPTSGRPADVDGLPGAD